MVELGTLFVPGVCSARRHIISVNGISYDGRPLNAKMGDVQRFLPDGSEMAARIRAHDWSQTALGPIDQWPAVLRHSVSFLLSSKAQIVLFWGPELVAIYNDAYRPVFGRKHPWALGRPAREAWSEVWDFLGPRLRRESFAPAKPISAKARPFFLERHGIQRRDLLRRLLRPGAKRSGRASAASSASSARRRGGAGRAAAALLRELGTPAAGRRRTSVCREGGRIPCPGAGDVPFALLYLRRRPASSSRSGHRHDTA